VNNAITQMDNVTQQNAAVVEQASAASKAMEEQSSTLVAQIGYFKLGKGSSAHEIRQGDTAAMLAQRPAFANHRPITRSPVARPAAPRKPAPTPAAVPATMPTAMKLPRASGDESTWDDF
jgi:methyl-accepting chemotaxis protein